MRLPSPAACQAPGFFTAGGTLPPKARSYVPRRADEELLGALREGEYCHVLASSQMGKSSLMVRTVLRLRAEGVRTAVLDLSGHGLHLPPEQWYRGLLEALAESLGLDGPATAFWRAHAHLGPARRWSEALLRVLLPAAETPLVVFVDEINALRGLVFGGDEFLGVVREFHSRRGLEPELGRLTFCLLGAAIPGELVANPQLTPFNVGRRVELADFDAQESERLRAGFPAGERVLRRVFHWTGGHPYLTQRLCAAVAGAASPGPADVDAACARLFFTAGAQPRDSNLLFAREQLLRDGDELRTRTLLRYDRVLAGSRSEEPTGSDVERLRLAGVVREQRGRLVPRNRIYRRVFDREWVAQHIPGAELRRQRAAYRRGVLRAAALGAIVAGAIGALAFSASRNAARANELAHSISVREGMRRAEEGNYEGALSLLQEALRLAGGDAVRTADDRLRIASVRRAAPRLLSTWSSPAAMRRVLLSPDGQRVLLLGDATAELHDLRTGERVGPTVRAAGTLLCEAFSDDSRLLALGDQPPGVVLLDTRGGRQVGLLPHRDRVLGVRFLPDGRRIATVTEDGLRIWETGGRLLGQASAGGPLGFHGLVADGFGRMFAAPVREQVALFQVSEPSPAAGAAVQSGRAAGTTPSIVHVARLIAAGGQVSEIALSRDGRRLFGGVAGTGMKCWDVASGRRLTEDAGAGLGEQVCASPTGCMALGAGGHGPVSLCDGASGRIRPLPPGAPQRTVAIRFGPTGRTAAALSANGRVAAWEIPSGREAWPAVLLPGPLRAAAFSTDLTVAVTVDLGGKVQAWEGLEPAAPRPVLEHCLTVGPSGVAVTARAGLGAAIGNVRAGAGFRGLTEAGKPEAAEISPDGRRVALAEADGTVRLCAADQTGPERLLRHPDRIRGMAFSPRGDRLFTLCQDGAARLWDVQSGELAVPPIRHFNGPYAFVQGGFSDRGELLLRAITGDVEIRAAAPPYAPVARVNPAAETARFVSGTRRFLTGTSDGFLALWDPAQASGELDTKERPNNLDAPMLPKGPHGDLVLAVTSSSDGRLAATGSADSYARLWDLRIGALLIPGLPHEDPVVQVEFSADARRLATGTDQGEVRLWDVRTGQPLTLPERCGEKATLLRFSNDGRMLLVVTEGRRLYRIPI